MGIGDRGPMSYVYMRVLESAPERYEWGMRLLTVGRLDRVFHDIAACLDPAAAVLDLGCGTGALAVQLARQGCRVVGIDISAPMLAQATQRLQEEGLENEVVLRELGVTDLDVAFGDASFDAVTGTLVFSELSDEEIRFALDECQRLLRSGGQLLIADEVVPDSLLGKAATFLFRLPFVLLAFVLTQNTTHRVARLDERLERAGFRLREVRCYLAGTLRLYVAEKVG